MKIYNADDIFNIILLQSRWTMTEANILYCSVSVRYRVMNNSSKSFFRWIISEIFCCWKQQQNELPENLGKTCLQYVLRNYRQKYRNDDRETM